MIKLEQKIIRISYELLELPQGRFKHLSFLCRKNRIFSIGWNNQYKSCRYSPMYPELAQRGTHSEASCILNGRQYKDDFHRLKMYNVRINNNGVVAFSMPCAGCQALLSSHGIVDIFYTNDDGVFERFVPSF